MKQDNRRHKRFPVVKGMAEPVDLLLLDGPHPGGLPAVLTNISGGGMSLVVFAPVHGDTRLKMVLGLPGLDKLELQGRVAWTHPKGETTTIGVEFNHVSADAVKCINHMAEAHQDCELKISFGLRDVCFKACNFWALCDKPVKLKH